MERRSFLGGLAAAATIPLASSIRGFSEPASGTVPVPAQIKAFSIDFNWETGVQKFAAPGLWADADPEKHIRWYENLGANVVQTFAVSCNGYAWYKHGFVQSQPGLKHDFLTDMVRLGHKRGMQVMGYFCIGANSKWGIDHPDLSYGAPAQCHIPLTDAYLNYLCRSIEDTMEKTGMDGFMIDWVWNPGIPFPEEVRKAGWLPAEQRLFEKLTGTPFPTSGRPEDAEKLEYERKAIDRCWARIKETRDRVNPHCIIWLSCYDFMNPTVKGSRILQEVDWSMNENPDPNLYRSGKLMAGPHVRMIQNLVGWPTHDAAKFLADPDHRSLDLYGFASPGPNSLLAPIEEYLSKPAACFTGTDLASVNRRNITALAQFYRGLPSVGDKIAARCA
jgi:hypothetical protein